METQADYSVENEAAFSGFAPPTQNWSKLPHELIEALPLIETVGEMKVILYILRHTWGYHDTEKKITLDEFCNGRKRRDGTRLDAGTGLSKPTVIDGLERAIIHGFVTLKSDRSDLGRVKNFYSLAQVEVKELYPCGQEDCHRTEKDTLERNPKEKEGAVAPPTPADDSWPEEPSNPAQKQVKRMRAKMGSDPFSVGAYCAERQEAEGIWTVPEHRGLSPACAVFKEATGYSPAKAVREDIDAAIPNNEEALHNWYKVAHGWVLAGNRWSNVGGMLEWYAEGRTGYAKPQGNGRNGGSSGPREQAFSSDTVVFGNG